MALKARARTEIKCRYFGVNNGHEQGAHFVLSDKATVETDTELEMRIRYGLASIILKTPYDELEEAIEELYDELFPGD